jgi:hypothetical protein
MTKEQGRQSQQFTQETVFSRLQNFHRVDDSLASCASNPLVGDFLPPLTSFPPHNHLLSFSTGGGLTSGYVDGTFYDKITTNLIILFK